MDTDRKNFKFQKLLILKTESNKAFKLLISLNHNWLNMQPDKYEKIIKIWFNSSEFFKRDKAFNSIT